VSTRNKTQVFAGRGQIDFKLCQIDLHFTKLLKLNFVMMSCLGETRFIATTITLKTVIHNEFLQTPKAIKKIIGTTCFNIPEQITTY
jgi:hypothetical protein